MSILNLFQSMIYLLILTLFLSCRVSTPINEVSFIETSNPVFIDDETIIATIYNKGQIDIYKILINSKAATNLTNNGVSYSPELSSDNKRMVYLSHDKQRELNEIFLYDFESEYNEKLVNPTALCLKPFFSTNNKKVYFIKMVLKELDSEIIEQGWDFFSYDLESKEEVRLTFQNFYSIIQPFVSDENTLLFTAKSTKFPDNEVLLIYDIKQNEFKTLINPKLIVRGSMYKDIILYYGSRNKYDPDGSFKLGFYLFKPKNNTIDLLFEEIGVGSFTLSKDLRKIVFLDYNKKISGKIFYDLRIYDLNEKKILSIDLTEYSFDLKN